jgi:hypothetical protein
MSQHCQSTELTATATCTGEQDASAHREWALVCESADLPACVTGWEFPGQREAADAGKPGRYIHRPGFAHGGAGVAACWYGGARGVGRTVLAAAAGHLRTILAQYEAHYNGRRPHRSRELQHPVADLSRKQIKRRDGLGASSTNASGPHRRPGQDRLAEFWNPAGSRSQAATGRRMQAGWCGGTARPSGKSPPVSSKRMTPLHSRLHPCSGWKAMVWAASRSERSGGGHGGWCGHMASLWIRSCGRRWTVALVGEEPGRLGDRSCEDGRSRPMASSSRNLAGGGVAGVRADVVPPFRDAKRAEFLHNRDAEIPGSH